MIKRYRVNNQIRAPQVRVVDETGKNLGILETWKAFQLAKERNLDIIEIVPKISPPVCKIIDYGKFLYQKEKKERAQKIKTKRGRLKSIRFRINTSPHDLEIKARQVEKFFKEENKVKIEVILKGREKSLGEFVNQKFNEFLELIKQRVEFKIEQERKRTPRGMFMLITKK
ncbi:MAG: translation initiation factor IF-3 [Parcubacteria group bacterium CG11_big_fil_rev_8_21_14_0_20_39_14]|nr:MAG: translation initiation factor IF-3 [Parcubacteria group bacterium CG11_big_fil_rev_8_21_14_0_20_39_14]PIS34985.1 MAG: translation initiation factor IF-3 [Parcubacteria group bacterium CG08_land_8_20_14_0_20_38_56]